MSDDFNDDFMVHFPEREKDDEVGGGGNRPEPGIYLVMIETCRRHLNNKQEPSLYVETVVQKTDPGKEENESKVMKDYIPVPFPGCKDNRDMRLHAFCSRLNLLPEDAWGQGARSYSLQNISDSAQGKVCFIEVKPDTFTDTKTGVERQTTRVDFAGYFAADDERMESRWWMANGESPPESSDSGSTIDDI